MNTTPRISISLANVAVTKARFTPAKARFGLPKARFALRQGVIYANEGAKRGLQGAEQASVTAISAFVSKRRGILHEVSLRRDLFSPCVTAFPPADGQVCG